MLLDTLTRLFGAGPAQGPSPTRERGTTPGAEPRPASSKTAQHCQEHCQESRQVPRAQSQQERRKEPRQDGHGSLPRPVRARRRREAGTAAQAGSRRRAWHRQLGRGRIPGRLHRNGPRPLCPSPDGQPDPGRIVWTSGASTKRTTPRARTGRCCWWAQRRLPAGPDADHKDHDGDSRRSEDYVDIGTGPWDRQGGPAKRSWTGGSADQPRRRPARRSGAGRGPVRAYRQAALRQGTAGADRPRKGRGGCAESHSCPTRLCYYLSCVSVQVDGHSGWSP